MAKKPTAHPSPAAVAYSYVRFSTPEQRKGDSLRRQTDEAADWCQRTGVRLDTSLTFHDLGKSAYLGEHRCNPDRHALAAFLRAVDEGKVRPGSYLIIESLDRLSREHVDAGLMLLLGLTGKGIRIVQLTPTEIVYQKGADPMSLVMAIMELSRGHSESKQKSFRVARAWAAKKEAARVGKLHNGKLLTRRLPAWVKVDGDRLVLDQKRAAIVRRIYHLAAEGHGFGAIVNKLNGEKVPVIGRAEHWARSYVSKLLTTRATTGEYQPHRREVAEVQKPDGTTEPRRRRSPEGDAIPNYFPPVVTEAEWHAARLATAGRKNKTGHPGGSNKTNGSGREAEQREPWAGIFSGLLRDARDGGPTHYVHKGEKSAGYMLVPYRAAQGVVGSQFVSFPAVVFEDAVLSKLREVDPRDILPRSDQATDKVSELAGREVELAGRVDRIKAAMLAGGDVESAVDVLRKLDAQLATLRGELAQARAEAASPLAGVWGEVRPLVELLKSAPDPADARTRLRAAVRRIVSEVLCLFVPPDGNVNSVYRFAVVQLRLKGGGQRDYLILNRRAVGGSIKTPGWWRVRSAADAGLGVGFDLRKRASVREMVKVLESLDPRVLMPATRA